MSANRREFLKVLAGTGVAAAFPFGRGAEASTAPSLSAAYGLGATAGAKPGNFDFVFFTDTHIEPELNAAAGCASCFQKIEAMKPEFAIMGGDHVYDAASVDGTRANLVFDLYRKTQAALEMPLHHVIGNHDIFGVIEKSGVAKSDPLYGKKIYEERVGRTYYSFEHKGHHFVVLDSIQPTEDRLWEARIDEGQMKWLAEDLQKAGAGTPVIVAVHVPIVTAFSTFGADYIRGGSKYSTLTVANAPEVLRAFDPYNVIAVLQGHTHINETVQYKKTQYITGGAVCGNWWHGPHMGFPEGFTVVSLRGGKISTRYETYGFQSVDVRDRF